MLKNPEIRLLSSISLLAHLPTDFYLDKEEEEEFVKRVPNNQNLDLESSPWAS
jgi:hypothetical protein